MTLQIGPIILPRPIQNDFDEGKATEVKSTVNDDNIRYTSPTNAPTKRNVKIRVPFYIYNQLKGISTWKNPYPINLDDLYIDQLGIRGYGYISNVKLNTVLAIVVECSFDVTILEHGENRYLKMDYTNGTESNSIIPLMYPPTVNETVFTDHFTTTFDTTATWEPAISSGLTGGSISISSGKLALSGAATTNNVRGTIFTVTQDPIDTPFTMDFDMQWVRYATTYANAFHIGLFTEKPVSVSEFLSNDQVRSALYTKPTYCNLHFQKIIDNAPTAELASPDTLNSSTEKVPRIRLVVDKGGKLTIYKETQGRDMDTYGTKVWGPTNPGWDISEGLYIGIGFNNYKNTSETYYCADIDMYNMIQTAQRNVVPFPPKIGIISPTPTFSRSTEEGTISLCTNPQDYMIFQTNFEDFDLGSVKVFNNNNEASDYRRVFNQENVFLPESWYATNGLVKLDCANNLINFKYWKKDYYDNLVDANIATCTNTNSNTTGFSGSSGETIVSSTDWHVDEPGFTKSLKCTTNGSSNNEYAYINSSYRPSCVVGRTYTAKLVGYGLTGTIRAVLIFRDDSGNIINYVQSSTITLDGSIVEETLSGIPQAGATKIDAYFQTYGASPQSISIYTGKIIIVEGTEILDTMMDISSGDLGDWDTLKQFDIGTIKYVKPYFISPERCIIQINGTYWWLFRGKPHILVNHEDTPIYFTRETCYDHDGVVFTPVADNVEVTMDSNFYCNIWNKGTGTCSVPAPDVNYRLSVIKATPQSIYTNYIPADRYTGFMVYDARVTDESSANHHVKSAREFFNVVDTRIRL